MSLLRIWDLADYQKLTEAQRTAIEALKKPIAILAGAGSGKTKVLTYRYLYILSTESARIDEIVAITFTKKAAGEMKSRISQLLLDLERTEQLSDFAIHARISTIHSFCASIIREHAIEANLAPDFHVIEPELVAEYLAKQLNDYIRANLDSSRQLRELVLRFGWASLVQMLIQLYSQRDKFHQILHHVINHDLSDSISQIDEITRNAFGLLINDSAARFKHSLDEFLANTIHVPDNDNLKASLKATNIRINELNNESLTHQIQDWSSLIEQLRTLTDIAKSIKLTVGSEKNWGGKESFAEYKNQIKEFRWVLDWTKDFLKDYNVSYEKQIYWIGLEFVQVIQSIFPFLDQALYQSNLLDNAGLQLKANDILDNEHVNKQVRENLKFLMVDEFQDTDALQYSIFKKLVSPLGSQASPNFMVVGDDRQAIYRFRGAEIEVFNDAVAEIQAAGGTLVNLAENFRSTKPIIDTVNLVHHGLVSGQQEATYAEHFHALTATRTDAGKLTIIKPIEIEEVNARQSRLNEAKILASYVTDLIRNERINPRDIVFLFRALTQINPYLEALSAFNIPFQVLDKKGLFQQAEVMDAVNLLKYLANPSDKLNLAALLRSSLLQVEDNKLLQIPWDKDELYPELIESIIPEFAIINSFLSKAADKKPSHLLWDVLGALDYFGVVLASKRKEAKSANFERLWSLMLNAEINSKDNMHDMIEYLLMLQEYSTEGGPASIPDEDSVQIMTVHKAKGLEFKVVVLPDLDHQEKESYRQLNFHKSLGLGVTIPVIGNKESYKGLYLEIIKKIESAPSLAEKRRLLYVAITRAQDRLVIYLSPSEKQEPIYEVRQKKNWHTWLSYFDPELQAIPGSELIQIDPNTISIQPLTKSDKEATSIKPTVDINRIKDLHLPTTPAHVSITEILDYSYGEEYYTARYITKTNPPEALVYRRDANYSGGIESGLQFHKILENLEPFNLERSTSLISNLNISDEEKNYINKSFINLLQHPYCKLMSTSERYHELNFAIMLDSGVVIEGIIDLLWKDDYGWRIFDLKSHNVLAEDVDSLAKQLILQLEIYAWAIKKITGEPVIDVAFYFTHPQILWQQKIENSFDKTERVINDSIQGISRLLEIHTMDKTWI